MPRITRLEAQKRNPERVNVFLDGRFAVGVHAAVVLGHGLAEGQELSAADLEELESEDAGERAFGATLNFLSYRPRSRREIEDYLRKRKVEPEVSTAVIERLVRAGLLDDREFARFWIENRQSFRPRGSRALRVELRQKGLDSEAVDEALEDLGDEEESAYQAGLKRMRSFERLDDREFFRKMVGFLQRRGFPYAVAAAAARRLRAGITAGEEGGEGPQPDRESQAT